MLGPKLVRITREKIRIIYDRLWTAQSQQKSYTDKRMREIEFGVGDHVFLLKVSPSK